MNARHPKSSNPGSQTISARRSPQAGSGHGFGDISIEPREGFHVVAALAAQALDDAAVLVEPPLLRVQLARAEQPLVVPVDPRHARRDLVAEVGIAVPADRPLGDPLDDGAAVTDLDFKTAPLAFAAAD